MSASPRVSVIMPVYNGEAYLRAAIDSILAQSFSDFELLLVNDGSTDRSAEIIETYGDPRIRVLHAAQNRGAAATKNRALDKARGELIAFLDCDDLAHSARLETQVRYLDTHPEIGVLGSRFVTIDENGKPSSLQGNFVSQNVFASLLFTNGLVQSAIMLRRCALAGERFASDREPAEDYDFWIRLGRTTQLVNLPLPLVRYRIHAGGISSRKPAAMEAAISEIIRDQLTHLGLEPNPDEIEFHRSLCRIPVQFSREQLLRAEHRLMQLREANRKTRIYAESEFDAVLAHQWFIVTIDSWEAGLQAWLIYCKSPLRRLGPATLRQHASFLRRVIPASIRALFR
ncbi:MAG: glycosyltransferase [Verrucomicrobiota bacterium]